MTRLGGWPVVVVLTMWAVVRALEESVRIYVERAVRGR